MIERDGALLAPRRLELPQRRQGHAEYWPAAEDPAVVVIFQTDDYTPLMEIALTWGDTFDITTLPAISAEDGLKVGPDAMGRRQF